MSSWTQVHVSGLSETSDADDETLERLLADRFQLSVEEGDRTTATTTIMTWAGSGSTIIKRGRGYCFLSFLTYHGASIAVERINAFREDHNNNRMDYDESTNTVDLPMQLFAELSQPKPKKKKNGPKQDPAHQADLRLRRQRGAPVRKHPVIISSNKKKTGLGNKTK
jgi:hypothetical protein